MTDYFVIAYDIPCDKRRRKLAKKLLGFLRRQQLSVFEGQVRPARHEALRIAIEELIDHEEDRVRIHRLCPRCLAAAESLGLDAPPAPEEEHEII